MDHNLQRDLFIDWAMKKGKGHTEHRTELGFLTKEGKLVTSNNHACHAGLHHSGSWEFISDLKKKGEGVGGYSFVKDPIVAIYSTIVNKNIMKDEHKLLFADYLINRSSWSDCFLNPNAQDVVDSCWVLDPMQPSNYIAGACVATRWITEWPKRCTAWVAMVDAGVDENEAFFFSHGLESRDEDELFPIILNTGYAWHCPLEKEFDKHYFTNFIQNKGREDEAYQIDLNYRRVHRTWGEGDRLNYSVFGELTPRGEEKKVGEKINLNIFFKPKKVAKNYGHQYTSHTQLKNLVEDMKEIIYAS